LHSTVPECRQKTGHGRCFLQWCRVFQEGVMTHVIPAHFFGGLGRFFEHAAAVAIGFIMMMVGLALGVTMIMLPVGIVVGLLGAAIFIGGLFARIGKSS
jgi:hypothetical protein